MKTEMKAVVKVQNGVDSNGQPMWYWLDCCKEPGRKDFAHLFSNEEALLEALDWIAETGFPATIELIED